VRLRPDEYAHRNEHPGVCRVCGHPTSENCHEGCGQKLLDDPKTAAKTRQRYKAAARQYRRGKLPWFMFD
jgi:hypothetical protein